MIQSNNISETPFTNINAATRKEPWVAIFSMAMSVAGLVLAELLPISLLTPMANDLRINEGSAGQAITATAIVAIFSSLFSAVLTRRIDRRYVILTFSLILVLSNLIVAFTPNYPILLAGRLLLGVAVGGFWAMAASTAMQIVSPEAVPKAFSIIFGSTSITTAIGAPLGSFLGDYVGWRGAFIFAALFSVASLVFQYFSMPSVPPSGTTRIGTLVDVLKRPSFGLGMICVLLMFGGHFAIFTYLRPFLETETGISGGVLSAVLLGFGIANFIGTSIAGSLFERNQHLFLALVPLLMAVFGGGLIFVGTNVWATAVFVALWSMAMGTISVAWSIWVSRSAPDEAESGGGLLVTSIQIAITLGASGGGLLFGLSGVTGAFAGGGIVLLIASIIGLFIKPVPAER